MTDAEQKQEAGTPIDFEAETDEAIALCDGDARTALKATLIANAYLESELERIVAMLSSGYGRGLVRKPAERPTQKAS